ncbi:putative F-box protein At5g62660 [Papaver somniferum]|uniref:putative F-box protein At5g62660 n=1 Tax=Papaver somniferum TaxID=3469 RepID=UPI000E70150D|nr:putative F-box protein At5g62660 [Papaver somniferum]XP_026417497.1 putative F-box protein At5g62660 [Papaver somniferum]
MTTKKMKPVSYNYENSILCDILSRLPLKSLMRFKCVSKSWQSLIEKDQCLVELQHRRQSHVSPRLFMILFPLNSRAPTGFETWTANLFIDRNKEKITIEAISRKVDLSVVKQVKRLINGMICLLDQREGKISIGDEYEDHAACLYNAITQEVTPWIRSTYLTRVKRRCNISKANVSRVFEFGFDPNTKEYKVICMWCIAGNDLRKFEGCGEYKIPVSNIGYKRYYSMCEILTIGKDTAWRRIDKIPPSPCIGKHGSVYANGSIYWMCLEKSRYILVAFDVGSEECRVMPVLDFIGNYETNYMLDPNSDPIHLMEVDGHLAIEKYTGNHTVNLWILDNDCEKNISTRNSKNIHYCRNIHWTKEIIMLPLHWRFRNIRFHAIVGTEYLISQGTFSNERQPLFIHSYNRKKKTFSKIIITGDGRPSSSFIAYIGHPLSMFTPYVESLLTLQSSYRPATRGT